MREAVLHLAFDGLEAKEASSDALIGGRPGEGRDSSKSREVYAGQCLLPDGMAIDHDHDHDHEVEPPGIRLAGAAAPPNRPEPLSDPQGRSRRTTSVVVRCRVGVGLAFANDIRELVQQRSSGRWASGRSGR